MSAADSFEAIRRQVAAWHPEFVAQRQGIGLLITRITEGWGAPPPPPSWWASELGRLHRTPMELAEEQQEAESLRELVQRQQSTRPPDSDHDAPSGYLDDHPAWVELAAEQPPFLDKLAGLSEVTEADGVPLFRFAALNQDEVGWLADRAAIWLRRKMSAIVGQPVLVEVFA